MNRLLWTDVCAERLLGILSRRYHRPATCPLLYPPELFATAVLAVMSDAQESHGDATNLS